MTFVQVLVNSLKKSRQVALLNFACRFVGIVLCARGNFRPFLLTAFLQFDATHSLFCAMMSGPAHTRPDVDSMLEFVRAPNVFAILKFKTLPITF
jgi:hypothetical protein